MSVRYYPPGGITSQSVQTQSMVRAISASDATFSGTVRITGGPNITVGTDASGVSISGAGGVGAGLAAISASDTVYTSGTVKFTGSNQATIRSTTGQAVVVDVTTAAQSSETGKAVPLGNTAGTTGSLPFNANIGIAGGNNITVSQSSGTASTNFTISGPNTVAQSVQPGVQHLVASDNTFSSGTVSITGTGGGVTINTAASKIQVSVAAPVAQTTQPVGSLDLAGNTAGTMATIPFASNIELAGGPNITLSQSSGASSSRVSISGVASQTVQTQNMVALSASDHLYSSGTVNLTGSNMITVKSSGAGQTVILDATQSVQTQSVRPKQHIWQNIPDINLSGLSSIQAISKTPIYFPVTIDGDLTANSVGVRLAAVSSVASSVIQSFSIHFGIYTLVNSTSAALAGSASNSVNLSSTASASYLTGRDFVLTSPSTVAGMSNLTPGNYVFGLMFSGAASQSHAFSIVGGALNATSLMPSGAVFPGNNSFSTGTTQGLNGFYGQGSSTVNAMPANVSVGDIRQQATASQPLLPYVFIRS